MISENEKYKKLFHSMPRFKTPHELVLKVNRLIENEDLVLEKERIYNYLSNKIRRLKTAILSLAVALIVMVPLMLFYIMPNISNSKETVYMVKFVYRDTNASKVSIVGDFNGWNKKGIPMRRVRGTDLWIAEVTLKSGTYRYNFLINGKQWAADPFSNINIKDKFGNESSVIVLLQSVSKESKL